MKIFKLRTFNLSRIGYKFSSIQADQFQKVFTLFQETSLEERLQVSSVDQLEKAASFANSQLETAARANQLQIIDSFTSHTALKDILRVYIELKDPKALDEYLIAQTLENLAKRYGARDDAQGTYWDLSGQRLKEYPAFKILLFDFKKISREIELFELGTLKQLAFAARTLELNDPEIIEILQEKFINILDQKNSSLIGKKKLLLKIINYHIKGENQMEVSDSTQTEIQQLFEEIKGILLSNQQNFLRLFTSVKSIRETYIKFLNIQDNKYVTENVNLNFKLLELEEFLIENGVLSHDETLNPELIKNQSEHEKFLLDQTISFISKDNTVVESFINFLFQPLLLTHFTETKVDLLSQEINLTQLSQFMIELGNLVNSQSKNYKYVKGEWSAIFNDQQCDRQFNQQFIDVQQTYQKYFKKIRSLLASNSNSDICSYFALAFAQIGLIQESEQIYNLHQDQEIDNHALINQLQATMISGIKMNQGLLSAYESKFLLNIMYYDDQELVTGVLGLLYQLIVHKNTLISLPRTIEYLIERFYNIENPQELDTITLEYLQDIYQCIQVLHIDKSLSKVLHESLFGTKVGRLRPEQLNPYIAQIQKPFTGYTIKQEYFREFPQIYSPTFFYSGTKTIGVFVVPFNELGLNGEIDGRVIFRQQVLQKFCDNQKLNMVVKTLPIANLIEFSQEQGNLVVRPTKDIQVVLDEVLEISQTDYEIHKLLDELNKIKEYLHTKNEDNSISNVPYLHIQLSLSQINQLLNSYERSVSLSSKVQYLEQIKFKLLEIQIISRKVQDFKLEEFREKPTIQQLIQEIIKSQQQLIGNQTMDNFVQSIAKPIWSSQLQSQSVLNVEPTNEGFCISLLDQEQYLDQNYCAGSYESTLKRSGLLGPSMYQEQALENYSAGLVLQPHIRLSRKITLPSTTILPKHNHKRQQIQPQFKVFWRHLFAPLDVHVQEKFKKMDEFIQQDQIVRNAHRDEWFILNLCNLKAELKKSFKPDEVVQKILSLDIWEQILEDRLTENSEQLGIFLLRDPREVFKQRNYTKSFYEQNSPSIQFLTNKVKERTKIKQLLKNRHGFLQKLKLDVSNNKLTLDNYKAMKKFINETVASSLRNHKAQTSQTHTSIWFKKQVSFFDVKSTNEDIKKLNLIKPQNSVDMDIITCDGSLEQYLQIIRGRAEDKLILYRILYKKYHNQALHGNEQQFLTQLKNQDHRYNYEQRITNLTIDSLSQKDKQFFENFTQSAIHEFKEFSLNELVFELSSLFEDQVYNETIKRYSYAKLQSKGLYPDLLKKQIQATQTLQIWEKENQIWGEESKLNEKEINSLIEQLRVPEKLISLKPEKQEQERIKTLQSIQLLNNLNYPQLTIRKWIKARQNELSNQVNIEGLKEQEKQENNQLWERVFGTTYEQTNTHQLNEFNEELIQRMLVLKYHQPFFFRRLIKLFITHPELSIIDRMNLAGYLQQFDLDIDFDSEDVLDIAKAALQRQNMTNEKILCSASYPYLDKLWSLIQ